MTTTFWLYGEDLASGLVGPFSSREAAEEHRAFCEQRGDADPGTVVPAEDLHKYSADFTNDPRAG